MNWSDAWAWPCSSSLPGVAEWEQFVKVNVFPVEHFLRNSFGEDGQARSDVNLFCRFLL